MMAQPLHLVEATVADIHWAFARREISCRELVAGCLARIDAFDRTGPSLRAVITVNPHALEIADELDRRFADAGLTGPLHGVPTILKDNFNTFDMPTTAGHIGMRTSQPREDAFTVKRMRAAGAVILAKSNLSEFALGGLTNSSLGGQTLNPYDLTLTPGGSSGGTGAAIAASYAVLGTGSDTGQSIRSPASATCLVGIRPTRGLVSRAGVVPNSFTQDEVGPMTRTVRDAALLLEVMAAYDPDDPITAFGRVRPAVRYTDALREDALQGARIGLMHNMQGAEARHRVVNAVVSLVVERFRALGATVIPFDIPEYDALADEIRTVQFEARIALDRYFAALGPDAPVKSIADVIAARTSLVQKVLEGQVAIVDGMSLPEYQQRMLRRDRLRLIVAARMAELGLDAILYPLQKVLVVPLTADDQVERNGTLSNGTGFPAITFPGGFSPPTPTAPLGVPVGIDLLGLDYTEGRLLSYAYAYERAYQPRKSPLSTPALAGAR